MAGPPRALGDPSLRLMNQIQSHLVWYKNLDLGEVEIPDKYMVKITLPSPNGSFLDRLAAYFAVIPNREATEQLEKDYRTLNEAAVIGTGPYILTQFRAGQEVRIRKNPEYLRKDEPLTDG